MPSHQGQRVSVTIQQTPFLNWCNVNCDDAVTNVHAKRCMHLQYPPK